MKSRAPIFRLVERRIATLGEIRSCWTRGDVLDMHDYLDAKDEAEAEFRRREEAKRPAK